MIKTNKKISTEGAEEVKTTFSKDGETVEVRKIKNGFIARRNYTEGEGEKRQYKTEEVYYEKNPL